MREFAHEQGVVYFEAGRAGIEHVAAARAGAGAARARSSSVRIPTPAPTGRSAPSRPGMGSTDIAMAMATGDIWMKVPPTIKFVFHGKLQPWVGGKDLILHTIGRSAWTGRSTPPWSSTARPSTALPMDGRFTMANMAIEAGGKAGIFPVDEKTEAYVAAQRHKSGPRPVLRYSTDSDADYIRSHRVRCEHNRAAGRLPAHAIQYSSRQPGRLHPHRPGRHRELHQRQARATSSSRPSILKGRKVHPSVRCIVIPATQQVYFEAMERDWWRRSSTPARSSARPRAVRVSAATWECWPRARSASQPRTGTSWAGWAADNRKSTWLVPPSQRHSAIAGHIAGPEEVQAQ